MKAQRKPSYATYRPGQLVSPRRPLKGAAKPKPRGRKLKLFIMIVAIVGFSAFAIDKVGNTTTYNSPHAPTASAGVNYCAGNTHAKEVVVSISKQHLWACAFSTAAYSSPVITGYTKNPADITPTGTYSVFTKERNVTLTGNDGVTSWSDPVSYWMPFLFNSYGAYGFHDATWRTPDEFGKVNINTPEASHGCVECPLATAKWLYGWVEIGTQVKIEA